MKTSAQPPRSRASVRSVRVMVAMVVMMVTAGGLLTTIALTRTPERLDLLDQMLSGAKGKSGNSNFMSRVRRPFHARIGSYFGPLKSKAKTEAVVAFEGISSFYPKCDSSFWYPQNTFCQDEWQL